MPGNPRGRGPARPPGRQPRTSSAEPQPKVLERLRLVEPGPVAVHERLDEQEGLRGAGVLDHGIPGRFPGPRPPGGGGGAPPTAGGGVGAGRRGAIGVGRWSGLSPRARPPSVATHAAAARTDVGEVADSPSSRSSAVGTGRRGPRCASRREVAATGPGRARWRTPRRRGRGGAWSRSGGRRAARRGSRRSGRPRGPGGRARRSAVVEQARAGRPTIPGPAGGSGSARRSWPPIAAGASPARSPCHVRRCPTGSSSMPQPSVATPAQSCARRGPCPTAPGRTFLEARRRRPSEARCACRATRWRRHGSSRWRGFEAGHHAGVGQGLGSSASLRGEDEVRAVQQHGAAFADGRPAGSASSCGSPTAPVTAGALLVHLDAGRWAEIRTCTPRSASPRTWRRSSGSSACAA